MTPADLPPPTYEAPLGGAFVKLWDKAAVKLAVREALERAAKECDVEGDKWVDHTSKLVGYHCAKTIRAIAEEYK